MIDIASLAVEVKSDSVAQANQRLDQFQREGKGAESTARSLTRATDIMRSTVQGVVGRLQSLVSAFFSLKSAIAALGIGILARSFLDAATTTENLSVRLRTLLGSVSEGNRLFQLLSTLAAKVPFEFRDIMDAGTTLATVIRSGAGDVAKWTALIADLAAAFGMSIQDTAQNMVKALSAGAAAADTFRERGVNAFLGFTAGVSYSAGETRKRIMEEWEKAGSSFRGATALLAKTWDGTMSMLADKWFQFRQAVMNSGPFDYLKAAIATFNEYLDDNLGGMNGAAEKAGDAVVEYFKKAMLGIASFVDTVGPVVGTVWDALNDIWEGYRQLPEDVRTYGLIGAFLYGKKGLAFFAGVSWVKEKLGELKEYIQTETPGGQAMARGEPGPGAQINEWLKGAAERLGLPTGQPAPLKALQDALDELAANLPAEYGGTGGSGSSGPLMPLMRGSRDVSSGSMLERAQQLIDLLDRRVADARAEAKKLADDPGRGGGGGVRLDAIDAQKAKRYTESLRTPLEQYQETIKELNRIVGVEGGISWETYGRAVKQAQKDFDDATDAELRKSRDWADGVKLALREYYDSATNMGAAAYKSVSSFLQKSEDAFVQWAKTGKLSVSDLFDFIQEQLIRLAYQEFIASPITSVLKGIDWSSMFSFGGGSAAPTSDGAYYMANVAHEGGMYGGPNSFQQRPIAAAAIQNARRFHDGGLAGDERAAVVKEGEITGWPNQLRQAFGGSDVNIQIIDQRGTNAPAPEINERRSADGTRQIKILIRDSVRDDLRSGQFDKELGSSFGLARQGTRR